MKADFNMNTK